MVWTDFDDIWWKYLENSRIEFACFGFYVGLLVITLSSLKLHAEYNACMLCTSVSCWASLFLQHLRCRSYSRNWYWWIYASREITLAVWLLWGFVFLTLQQRLDCVDVIISTRTASAAARTPVDCSELHQQPLDSVLRPTFVQQLCYKLSSVVTFTFIQIFDQNFVSFTKQRQSCRVCLI